MLQQTRSKHTERRQTREGVSPTTNASRCQQRRMPTYHPASQSRARQMPRRSAARRRMPWVRRSGMGGKDLDLCRTFPANISFDLKLTAINFLRNFRFQPIGRRKVRADRHSRTIQKGKFYPSGISITIPRADFQAFLSPASSQAIP